MYARITRYRCDPSRLEEMIAEFDEIKVQVKEISGIVHVCSAWRPDGNGITTAIYESLAAAEAASPQVHAIWAGLAHLLIGPPQPETYENVELIAP